VIGVFVSVLYSVFEIYDFMHLFLRCSHVFFLFFLLFRKTKRCFFFKITLGFKLNTVLSLFLEGLLKTFSSHHFIVSENSIVKQTLFKTCIPKKAFPGTCPSEYSERYTRKIDA